ncbi:hypothetical protein [Ensifer soli]|uniref:hypothetical protein n=1 Tax=Ciceribacter sp. sgz301302 TaxID=3342379 RepID=UPI0035BACE4D
MSEELCFDHIRLSDRPLLVCDIDEVVLEFLTPFENFLGARGLQLLPRSFRLHGNILPVAGGEPAGKDEVDRLLEGFFCEQEQWQGPAACAVETLAALSREADLVFLTAMPPRHALARRRLLDRFGLDYPLLATEDAKGPVVRRLHAGRPLPVAFLDDIDRNLLSVFDHVPDCLLIRIMAHEGFRKLAPAPGRGVLVAEDWPSAAGHIRQHFGLEAEAHPA